MLTSSKITGTNGLITDPLFEIKPAKKQAPKIEVKQNARTPKMQAKQPVRIELLIR